MWLHLTVFPRQRYMILTDGLPERSSWHQHQLQFPPSRLLMDNDCSCGGGGGGGRARPHEPPQPSRTPYWFYPGLLATQQFSRPAFGAWVLIIPSSLHLLPRLFLASESDASSCVRGRVELAALVEAGSRQSCRETAHKQHRGDGGDGFYFGNITVMVSSSC